MRLIRAHYAWVLAGLFAVVLASHVLVPISIYRRALFGVVAFLALLPWLPIWFRGFRGWTYYDKVAAGFFAFSLTIKLLPGGYFPPFYSGIAGWTLKVDKTSPLAISGLKFIRQDGQEIWMSNGITSPQNFLYRQISQCESQGASVLKQCLGYYMDLYRYEFPYLSQGRFLSEKYLGAWAYPGHNPYRMLNYAAFPPNDIQEIISAIEEYDRKTLRLTRKIVLYRYRVADGALRFIKEPNP